MQIDMVISGGVNIYPAEIEDALHRHPAIEGNGITHSCFVGVLRFVKRLFDFENRLCSVWCSR